MPIHTFLSFYYLQPNYISPALAQPISLSRYKRIRLLTLTYLYQLTQKQLTLGIPTALRISLPCLTETACLHLYLTPATKNCRSSTPTLILFKFRITSLLHKLKTQFVLYLNTYYNSQQYMRISLSLVHYYLSYCLLRSAIVVHTQERGTLLIASLRTKYMC